MSPYQYDSVHSCATNPRKWIEDWNATSLLTDELPQDREIQLQCERFRTGTAEERRSLVRSHAGNLNLMIFSHRMANKAMRRIAEEDSLRDGIIALLLENCSFDPRDSQVQCAILRYAADCCGIKLGQTLASLGVSNGETYRMIDRFAAFGGVDLQTYLLELQRVGDCDQVIISLR